MQVYGRMTLQRRWRAWLSDRLVGRWLTGGHYYHLNLVSGDHQNPESRIADDVRVATESPVDFVTGVVSAALSAIIFIAVLWSIGGTLELSLGGYHLGIPGFLVVGAVVYALRLVNLSVTFDGTAVCRRGRHLDNAGRARAYCWGIGHREEHACRSHCRPLALGGRENRDARGREGVFPAATAVYADRVVAPRSDVSRPRRKQDVTRDC
jgi:hypothetical protein